MCMCIHTCVSVLIGVREKEVSMDSAEWQGYVPVWEKAGLCHTVDLQLVCGAARKPAFDFLVTSVGDICCISPNITAQMAKHVKQWLSLFSLISRSSLCERAIVIWNEKEFNVAWQEIRNLEEWRTSPMLFWGDYIISSARNDILIIFFYSTNIKSFLWIRYCG